MHIIGSYTALELVQLIVQGTTDLCVVRAQRKIDAEAVPLSRPKIVYIVERKKLKISVKKCTSHTTKNYSNAQKIFTTLLAITRVTSNFLLPYPTLLGFEKALLVIACL